MADIIDITKRFKNTPNADIIDMLSKKPSGANNTFKELGEAVKKTNPKVDIAAQTTARVGKVKPGPMFGARAAVGPVAIYQGIQITKMQEMRKMTFIDA